MRSPERDAESGERATKRIKIDESSPQTNDTGKNEGPADAQGNGEELAAHPKAPTNDKPTPAQNGSEQTISEGRLTTEETKTIESSSTETPIPEQSSVEKKVDARDARDRDGTAPIKAEYLLDRSEQNTQQEGPVDDDAAEGRGQDQEQQDRGDDRNKKRKKARGQNQQRSFGQVEDSIKICNSRAYYDEFSPRECRFGDRCKLLHDLRKYLAEGRREDVSAETFDDKCPVFESHGICPSGWKCRFVKGHMKEVEHEDGRKELVLLGMKKAINVGEGGDANAGAVNEDERPGVVNVVPAKVKIDLQRRRVDMSEAEKYITWLNQEAKHSEDINHRRKKQIIDDQEDLRAQYTEPPFKPSEKRKIYFGRETPALAPLTTQGNLPFRRLCVELGAELTYSEMAMGLPLIQGTKADWTLMKAHEVETAPPRYTPNGTGPTIVQDYDNTRDLRFGAQISANQPWVAIKATEALKRYVPHLRVVDLNCGCPIDMVYKSGAGSALLDAHGKMERIVRGMNAVSGEIPVTVKIRTGVKGNRPTAPAIIGRLAFGSREHRDRLGAPGCAAVTLHGRSREQRYSRRADWGYIAECATLVKSYNAQRDKLADTAAEPDESTLPNTNSKSTGGEAGKMFFLGNGDCYSYEDYNEHIEKAGVDSVMIGRGALVKPWLFEEIEKGQYIDKSASERLGYIERFVRYGLDSWGSDEVGISFTRRFLLEWLSFTHRYVPIGLLERLPPSLNDRPPAYRGRNELETLLASNNYKDWIKISEMFLGPCHPGFTFQPKHKSNAYEAEG